MFYSTIRSSLSALLLMAVASTSIAPVQAQEGFPCDNPIISDSGQQIGGVTYDPFTGKWVVRTDRHIERESAYDFDRHYMDPGSYQVVDEFQTDEFGVRWHLTGHRWTTNGKPHGDINRRRVSDLGGGTVHDENEFVTYSVGSKSNGSTNGKTPIYAIKESKPWKHPNYSPTKRPPFLGSPQSSIERQRMEALRKFRTQGTQRTPTIQRSGSRGAFGSSQLQRLRSGR